MYRFSVAPRICLPRNPYVGKCRNERATVVPPSYVPTLRSVEDDWSLVVPFCTKVSKLVPRSTVGSMVTGYTVFGSARNAASAVNTSSASAP
ncbi:hypothetical protein GCM10020229_23310 [Kitasatospora albolonga]